MKALILYDSQFGNTEKIAQAVASSIPLAKLLRASEVSIKDLKDINLLIVGSPTHGGRATESLQRFFDQISEGALADVDIAVFDTRFLESDLNFALRLLVKTVGYAAPKMATVLAGKGGKLIVPPEGFIVTGKEGPLAPSEIERAKEWIKKMKLR